MTGQPVDSAIRLGEVIRREAELSQAERNLETAAELVTVAFFDLEGSTEFRRERGAPAGLKKALAHNVEASRAIKECGGHVAKWLGDGVLGFFRQVEVGDKHTFLAVCAAIRAIQRLNELTCKEGRDWQDEIHTRVGISSGAVHFIKGHNDDAENALDPMGSPVDLAARLQSMAAGDVIAVDRPTFFGHAAKDLNEREVGVVLGATLSRELEVPWQELSLGDDEVRETVYSVQWSPFFLTHDRKQPQNVAAAETALAASRLRAPRHPVAADELVANGQEELRSYPTNGKISSLLFVSKPIAPNVRGFFESVDVVGVSLKPSPAPLRHVEHLPKKSDKIGDELAQGEALLLRKDPEPATQRFEAVLRADPRHFRALFRLAQLCHRKNQNEQALRYITAAKHSNAGIPGAWKLAGIIGLENFLFDGSRRDALDDAITDFAQAGELAAELFDVPMEHCCRCLVALCHFLRAEQGYKELAASELREVDWELQSYLIKRLKPILDSFELLANGDPDSLRRASALHEEAAGYFPSGGEGHDGLTPEQFASEDHHAKVGMPVLRTQDFRLVLNELKHRIEKAAIVR